MKIFTAAAATLFAPVLAFGWGDLGHQTVGEIAEILISQDAKTKQAIQNIMGVEPYAISATWPDHVRDDRRFDDFAPYHFTTIFRDPKAKAEKDAFTILQKYPNTLTSKSIPRASRMIAFRYIVHVVGDIHQPLHVGNEFDRGGNYCQVMWQANATRAPYQTNLHSAWDTALVEALAAEYKKLEPEVRYYGHKQLAVALMKKYADIVSSEPTVDVQSWVNESAQLRRTKVYPDQLPDDARPYCLADRNAIDAKDIPTLGPDYVAAALPIVEKQLVLGGVRLAAFLKEIFKNSRPKKQPTESQILELLKLHNH